MTQTTRGTPGTDAKPRPGTRAGVKSATQQQPEMPGWTNGLRQLYDQVVDEDLPDSFRDLLARLDDQS